MHEDQATHARDTPPRTVQATGQQAERQLLDGVERILRAPKGRLVGWALLALHLSAIPPPGARVHHRRVAAAVLDDAAARGSGQLFLLANGDLALLFRPADEGLAIGTVLARLFQADGPSMDALLTTWSLPQAAAPALDYLRTRVHERDTQHTPIQDRSPRGPEPQAGTGAVAAMDAVVQTGALSDLMHRQTAVLLRPGAASPLVPLFREVAISTAVLEARIAAAGQVSSIQGSAIQAAADPFLFNHLATRLDHRMLNELRTDVPHTGALSGNLGRAALHVNMTVPGILSAGFAAFADTCRAAVAGGLRIGVEVPFMEAFVDIKAFVLARERLLLSGMHLVLDGLTHQAAALTAPAVLQPALLKLSWSPAIATSGPAEQARLRTALAAIGPQRLVLHRVEDEAAVAWGLKHGILRFQGRYVDTMLAAARLRACPHGRPAAAQPAAAQPTLTRPTIIRPAVTRPGPAACTLRQCQERASATGPAGRAGCRNTPLLDQAAPAGLAAPPERTATPADRPRIAA